MLKYIYKPITNKSNFGGTRPKSAIKFIALHWTANTSPTADAENHYKYFQNHKVGASAHYFVDDKQIIQIVGDSTIAYAVGGNQGYGTALNGCTNYNSISIEMCVNKGERNADMLFNTIELVKNLLGKYPNAKVCRHYDATRKECPRLFVRDTGAYNSFLTEIKKPRKLIIDLDKCTVKANDGYTVPKPIEKPSTQKATHAIIYYKNDKDLKNIAPIINVLAPSYNVILANINRDNADEHINKASYRIGVGGSKSDYKGKISHFIGGKDAVDTKGKIDDFYSDWKNRDKYRI